MGDTAVFSSQILVWQLALFAILGVLFYGRQLIAWLRAHRLGESASSRGYLFATGYALLATLVVATVFNWRPLPRFGDVFLVGIVLTAYFFAATPAAYLMAISIAISAWILPPQGSFAVSNPDDQFRLLSFALISSLLVFVITKLKARLGAKYGNYR